MDLGAPSHLKRHAEHRGLTISYAELIEKLKTLPDEKQTEVFDFVDYLAARFANRRAPELDQWTNREFADMATQQALRGLDEDPVTYGDADLRERWQ